MRRLTSIALLLASLLLASAAQAKGDGVALRMEGTVSNLEIQGEKLRFLLTGNFSFKQWRGRDQTESSVDVDGSRGIAVTVVQSKPFYAMTEDGHGAAIREEGALASILRAAAEHKRLVKFQLIDAKLTFGRGGSFEVTQAAVIRATDADLR
jgi:hypothetical protein